MTDNPFQPIYDICNAGHSKEKLAKLPAFPRMIDVEMTNTCNFRCLMCPTGNFSQKRDKGFMDDAVFYKVLDEIRPHRTPLRFIRWGEPLTHPRILDYLRACRAAGVLTHINTNGSKMSEEMMDALLDIPLDSLKFSFQGVDRKSYAEMRNIDYFDELAATIRRLHEKRGNPVRLRPHEFEELKRLKELESVIKVHPECPEVFDKLSINWDGKITACCMDSDDLMILGNVHTQTLTEIWGSETLNRYRALLADMRHDELPLCKSCYDTHGLNIPGLQDT